ncbi:fibroblast growth factor receptor 1-like [Ptychodera flava]|uniref:fibroblast growth factor receptor 1-like n=1 Tax=Ptychodera flava TaxID=63121 RepID=UPI003969F312
MDTVQLSSILSLTLLVLVCITGPVASSISWAVTPKDAYVREGDTLTLNCSVNYSEHTSQFLLPGWTKRPLNGKSIDDIWIAINGTSVNDCCDVTGDKSKGESNLVIKRVTKESSGLWYCLHSDLRASIATITVIDPNDPVCTAVSGIGRYDEVIENTEVTLRCSLKTENITPPGRLVWYRNGVEIHSGNSPLDIKTTITRDDHGVPFSCRLEHSSSSSSISCLKSVQPNVQYPALATTPSNVCVKEGTALRINCEYVPGNPNVAAILWKIPGSESFTRQNPLIIDNVDSMKHSVKHRVYACKVYNTYYNGRQGESLSHTTVRVEYDPKVETVPVQQVKQGYDASLQCDAKAIPTYDMIQWITPSGSVVNSRTLRVQNVQIFDNGIYNCTARNTFCDDIGGYGLGWNYTYLDVLYNPKEVYLTGNTAQKTDESLTLTCTTSCSNPATTITWYRNGLTLQGQSDGVNITAIDGESSGPSSFITKEQIRIKLQPEDNEAKIQCSAKHPYFPQENNVFSSEIILSIFFPPNQPENCITKLTTTTQENELVTNSLLTLQCTSCSSNPPADISWYMDGIEMKLSTQGEHRQGQFNGTVSEEELQINLTSKHHGLSIYCVAANIDFSEQTYESQKIEMDVQYGPFAVNDKFKKRVAVNIGETAILKCQMNGNPSPSTQWYDRHGNQLPLDGNRLFIKENRKETIKESKLYIEDVDNSDYGRYYCRGKNKHGDVEIVIIVSRKSIPDAATNIEINMQAGVANVNWIAGYNGGDDQKFYVEYVKLPEGVKKTTELINDNELGEISVNISSLVDGSRYNMTVVSKNDIGENRSSTLTLMVEASNNGTSIAVKDSDTLLIILSSCAVVVIGVIVAVAVVYVIRRRNKANLRNVKSSHSYESINYGRSCNSKLESCDDEMDEPANRKSIPLKNIVTEDNEIECKPSADQTSDAYKHLEVRKTSQTYTEPGKYTFEFQRDRLHIAETLHTSRSYRIVKALAWFIDGKDGPSDVAIKTEIDSTDSEFRSNMLQEIKLMKKIHSDENVIRMLGYCTEEAPMVLIMEYSSYGNLKTYLKENRDLFTPGKHDFARRQMLAFATDVASGMKCLQRNKIVHRYLAVKHVLVCERGVCKISNFSYASGVMSDETFFKTKMKTQYQWMAPESLMHKAFTLKTDVWSFGVVIWEIFSLGNR